MVDTLKSGTPLIALSLPLRFIVLGARVSWRCASWSWQARRRVAVAKGVPLQQPGNAQFSRISQL